MKTLIQEYKKAFLNGGIWITAFAVFSINLINLWDELRLFPTFRSISVSYFWIGRTALGAFSIMTLLFCCFPYAISYCMERNSGSWKYYLIREGFLPYVVSKIIVTVTMTVLAYAIGYLMLWFVLHCLHPAFPEHTIDGNTMLAQSVQNLPFRKLALARNNIFFVLNSIPEICMCSFLSTFSLFVSGYTENKYIIVIAPLAFYYSWNYFTGLVSMPEIFTWPLKRMSGFMFTGNDVKDYLFTVVYYGIGIIILGVFWGKRVRQEMENA